MLISEPHFPLLASEIRIKGNNPLDTNIILKVTPISHVSELSQSFIEFPVNLRELKELMVLGPTADGLLENILMCKSLGKQLTILQNMLLEEIKKRYHNKQINLLQVE